MKQRRFSFCFDLFSWMHIFADAYFDVCHMFLRMLQFGFLIFFDLLSNLIVNKKSLLVIEDQIRQILSVDILNSNYESGELSSFMIKPR